MTRHTCSHPSPSRPQDRLHASKKVKVSLIEKSLSSRIGRRPVVHPIVAKTQTVNIHNETISKRQQKPSHRIPHTSRTACTERQHATAKNCNIN